ncbi:MAG: helix-turn-helix transcriptional regulator [Spirochaetia bacterium]|nr:helix-turn-helix transcriptional regulator [Spirochaetia bacterium]
MTELQHHLSMNMKALRKGMGISQADLAEKVGAAPNYISLIEQGKKFPSARMLERIAYALNIHSIELFSQEYSPNANIEQVRQEIIANLKTAVDTAFDRIKQ